MTEQAHGPEDKRTVGEVLSGADNRYRAREVASGNDTSEVSRSSVEHQLKRGNEYSWKGAAEGHWSNPHGPTKGMPDKD